MVSGAGDPEKVHAPNALALTIFIGQDEGGAFVLRWRSWGDNSSLKNIWVNWWLLPICSICGIQASYAPNCVGYDESFYLDDTCGIFAIVASMPQHPFLASC